MKECLFYEKLENNFVKCRACRHFCKIGEKKAGRCGVRFNEKGKLFLAVFGKAAAVNIDPVEKKPLYHFIPGTKTFSFGTVGCNFRCGNCQNFGISQFRLENEKGKVKQKEIEKMDLGISFSPQEIVSKAKQVGCSSIAYTYNEPTVFFEYALETMKIAKERRLKNIWVSNGYMSKEIIEKIIPLLDAFNIDIKSMDPDFYKKICGGKLEFILENCEKIAKSSAWLEITTLIIPGLSDQDEMLEKLACFIKKKLGSEVPWHLSAFSGEISWKMKEIPSTGLEKIKKAYKIGKKCGLKHVYVGNIVLAEAGNTFCPNCGRVLVKRNGWEVKREDEEGRCYWCGKKLAGVWK